MVDQPRFVAPYERLLYLSTLPLFGTLPPEELAVLARWTKERHFRRGEVLFDEGMPVPAIHMLVTGAVEVSRGGRVFRTFRAPDAVGVFGLLARTTGGVRAVARTAVTSLELAGDALEDIFEDRNSIFTHVLQATAKVLRDERRQLFDSSGSGSPLVPVVCPARELDLIERILLLRRVPMFAAASLVGLGQLSRRVRELRLEAGVHMWELGEYAGSSALLVCGSVECRFEGGVRRRGAGDAIGLVDLLAKELRSYAAVTVEPVVALVVDRDALLDMFEDHTEIGAECLASLARAVLDAFERRATAANIHQLGEQ